MSRTSQTNSWHWLLMALAGCLLVVAYPCHLVSKKAFERNSPSLERMEDHAADLKLLREDDVTLLEDQAAEIQKRFNAYEAAVRIKAIQPIPYGERSVLSLSNEISRALLKHQLRVIEQEQEEKEAPPALEGLPPNTLPDLRHTAAAQSAAAPAGAGKVEPNLPFQTREIRFVVEGGYKNMFMFLVKQSHLKPSYHLKGIRISPSSQQYGMRMEFTVQIHFN